MLLETLARHRTCRRWMAFILILSLGATLLVSNAAFGQVAKTQDQPDDQREAAIALLNEILSRPEFQWQEQQPSLLERLWQQILPTLVNLLPDTVAGEQILVPLLATLGFLATVAAFAYAIRSFRRDLAPDVSQDDTVPGDQVRGSEQALHAAQRLSAKGDYRQALRYLYLSALMLLSDRGFIQYDLTRTNREYLHSVASHPQLSATFQEIVAIFDRTWYGLSSPDADTYERFEALVVELQSL